MILVVKQNKDLKVVGLPFYEMLQNKACPTNRNQLVMAIGIPDDDATTYYLSFRKIKFALSRSVDSFKAL